MKFAVVGTGGVGGYFGGKLARNAEEVWFFARGSHLDAMRNGGLRIISVDGEWTVPPGRITDDPRTAGTADVILFSVKSYDTESAAALLAPLVSDSTIIISLQNGVDNEEKIARVIPRGVVFGGVSYIYSTITAPGVVRHTVGPTKILFGPLSAQPEEVMNRATAALNAMTSAGINATLTDDIVAEIWKKYVFIAAVGGMTALTRLPLGDILAVDAARTMLAGAMKETYAIGKAKGARLPDGFVEQTFELLKKYDNNSRSSLYHDLVNGRRMEISAFSGTIIRYGNELGIPTPVHSAIYAALLPHHLKHGGTI